MKLLYTLLLLPLAAHADDYCDYTKEKSQAEKILYQSPSLMVGFGRTNTGSASVLGVGVTESLSKYLQGNLWTDR